MKQGTSKKLKPKDKRETASWKKRDAGRKEKQEAYKIGDYPSAEEIPGDPDAEARASENA